VKRELVIDVGGQSLTIRSDESDAYVRGLASFVDGKVRELSRGQPGTTTLSLALTAALTIADELHKLLRTQDEVEQLAQRLSHRIEAALGQETA
jgi:cell division protein ZapA